MNAPLVKAKKWLEELDIICNVCQSDYPEGILAVSRDGMANIGDPNEILSELKSALSYQRFCWTDRDDNFFYLSTI
jgi:hypothetical protein